MTSQQLHDALSYLPDDLIEETDRRRNAPKRVIPFRRYAAFAASFALVLCSVWLCTRLISPKGATEEAAAPAAMQFAADTESAMLGAPKAETNVPAETRAAGIQEKSEAAADSTSTLPEDRNIVTEGAGFIAQSLETPRVTSGTACYTSSPRITLVHTPTELEEYCNRYDYQYHFEAVTEVFSAYDESWFETHDLLLLAIHSVPIDSICEITSVTETGGICEIRVTHDIFTPEKTDITDYHLLLTLQKNQIPDSTAVSLILETPG